MRNGRITPAGRTLDLAIAELQSALELQSELDLIADDYDCNVIASGGERSLDALGAPCWRDSRLEDSGLPS